MLVQHQGRVTRVMTTQGTNMRHRGESTHSCTRWQTHERRKKKGATEAKKQTVRPSGERESRSRFQGRVPDNRAQGASQGPVCNKVVFFKVVVVGVVGCRSSELTEENDISSVCVFRFFC